LTFNKYYQDELTFLSDLGKEFADANPNLAPFLADRGNDPDVERLLEGFAFLSGRLRQKLDDELPELTHGLMALLWPHYLRPVPSMSVLQFTPRLGQTEIRPIARGTEIDSIPVEGTPCRFQTCYDVDLAPLTLKAVEVARVAGGSQVKVQLEVDPTADLTKLALGKLRFFLLGEDYITNSFFLWLFRYLDGVTVNPLPQTGRAGFQLPASALRPVGFGAEEVLLPYPTRSFSGFRLLQEYFTLPEKFLFFELDLLEGLARFERAEGVELVFRFHRPLQEQTRLERRHLALHCTPVVNLFPMGADPVRLTHERTEYRVRPASTRPSHYEIFEVASVEGWLPGTSQRRLYHRFESFDHVAPEVQGKDIYYELRIRPAVVTAGVDTYIGFVDAQQQDVLPPTETVSIELVCSNRNLAEQLKIGDINRHTGSSPEFADFRNITQVTASTPPPMVGALQWRLITNLSLNYLSLTSLDGFRELIAAYDFQAFYDRRAERVARLRLEGIEAIEAVPAQRLFRGLPVRGRRVRLRLRESKFGTEGHMYLFASVLGEFLSLYASVNSFVEVSVHGIENGETYTWPVKSGHQPIV
jgi:type VI secretion system protein ImpG